MASAYQLADRGGLIQARGLYRKACICWHVTCTRSPRCKAFPQQDEGEGTGLQVNSLVFTVAAFPGSRNHDVGVQ
jgi:hypothetical protein